MVEPTGTGASADSPTAPDFAAYEASQNAIDLGRETAPSDVTPESSPAPSGDQSAATAAKPDAASVAAPPDGKKPRNLDTRHAELDDRIAELNRKLEIKRELEKQLGERSSTAKPADSQPATPSEPEWKRYANHPQAPKVDQFDTYEEYLDARALFIADRRLDERDRTQKLDAESRERVGETEQTIKGFQDRLAKTREADPDFDIKVSDGLMQFKPAFALPPGAPIAPGNALMQEIVRSEFSSELLLHFSDPTEGAKRWNALTSLRSPAEMLRAFGRIEARFESSGTAAEGDKPPAKPVTSAPAPPRTLGGRPPADPDRAGAAVKAGDFSAYEAAANAADLARARAG